MQMQESKRRKGQWYIPRLAKGTSKAQLTAASLYRTSRWLNETT
jgi:hypothetical protein